MSKTKLTPSSPDAAATRAEVRLPTSDPQEDAAFFREKLGFRLDSIFPADDPSVAVISGHGLRLRLELAAAEPPGTLRITADEPATIAGGQTELVAPNGTRIEIHPTPALEIPPTQHSFVVSRRNDVGAWVVGRAGMEYRDMIPGRLGGSVIASNIRIPNGGPVADMVHFHDIAFQLIYCYRGWVSVAYQDQGPPILLSAGECLIQPPQIRHRVLESSAGAEVIEVTVPAEHLTTIDHELELPMPLPALGKEYGGQRFCTYSSSQAAWQPSGTPGFEASSTGIGEATDGVADVQMLRWRGGESEPITTHDADILFTFVVAGSMTLQAIDRSLERLEAGDAFVLPPNTRSALAECSSELELLQVSLPGRFETVTHDSL